MYLDGQRGADATVEAVFAAGSTGVTVRADVTDDLDVARLFDETAAAFGRADVVVHAAAVDGAVLHAHAARRLARGGAIVAAAPAAPITPALARRLRERDIAVNGILAGVGAGEQAKPIRRSRTRWRSLTGGGAAPLALR